MTASRVFAALLRLYPVRTRDAFGQGITAAWCADLASARRRGAAAVVAFWAVTVADALRFGLAERWPLSRRTFTVDWRDAWRSLRSAPMVSLFCIVSLALGIGGVTALFSILNGLALKPLPVREPQRLVLLDDGSWTNPVWEAIRARQSSIVESAAGWATAGFNLAPSGEADMVRGLYVSGSFFETLGVRPAAGRLIGVGDDVRGGGAVAVISHAFWQSRFGGAADVLGRTLTIERTAFTIVGVTPDGFFGPDVGRAYDVAVPLAAVPLAEPGSTRLDDRLSWWMNVIARLRVGQTVEDATARLRAAQPQIRVETAPVIGQREDRTHYLLEPMTFVAAPGGRSPLRARFQRPLTAILAVIGLVLVIACANIASLLIARASVRRREIAVRLALGASRSRVARQLLAESGLLAAAGALCGAAIAWWGTRLLLAQFMPFGGRIDLDLTPDWSLLLFASGVTGVAALAAGLAPALTVADLGAMDALKERPGANSARPTRARHASVIVQVALSLALLVAAGLFTRTFTRLSTRDIGFDRDGVLLVDADLARDPAQGAARRQLFDRVVAAAAAAPGVQSAAASFIAPVGPAGWNTVVAVPASPLSRRQRLSWVNAVTPRWFETIGMRLLEGRDIVAADRSGAPRVAVVNRAFVRKFMGGASAVGQIFSTDEPEGPRRYEVVGVVEDAVYRSVRASMEATMYIPIAQADALDWTLVVAARSAGPADAIARSVPASIQASEPAAVLTARTLRNEIDASLSQERLLATLAIFFGALALLLAAVGLYGLTAFTVASRRSEIGIRIALGANVDGISRLVVRRIATLIAAGLAIGFALSLWTAPLVGTLLYDVEPRDPLTVVSAAGVLLAVAIAAAWLPARRAARIDPMEALRSS